MIPALFFSLVTSAQTPPVPDRPAAEAIPKLEFRWGDSGSVAVSELQDRNGTEVEKRYVVRWALDPKDGSRLFEFTDIALASYAGRPPEDPEVAEAIKKVEPLLRAMPKWRISRTGEFQGLADLEASVEGVLAVYRGGEGLDPDAERELRAMLNDPATRAKNEVHAKQTWKLWAEDWRGLEIAVGEERESRDEATIGGEKVPARVAFRCLGREVDAGADCVKLATITTLEGPVYLAALEKLITASVPRNPDQPDKKWLVSARKETSLSGTWEVATLRPHVATSVTLDIVEVPGALPQSIVQKHVYVFDWTKVAEPPR